jgi:hypothetical protein
VLRSVLGGDSAFDSSAGGLSGSMFVLSGTSGSSVPGVSGGIRVQSKDTSVGETVCVQARQVNGETSQSLAGRCRFESGVGGTSAMKGAVSVTSGSTSGPDESRLVTVGSDVAASGRLNHCRLSSAAAPKIKRVRSTGRWLVWVFGYRSQTIPGVFCRFAMALGCCRRDRMALEVSWRSQCCNRATSTQ